MHSDITAEVVLSWIAFSTPIYADSTESVQRKIYNLKQTWPVSTAALMREEYGAYDAESSRHFRETYPSREMWIGGIRSLRNALKDITLKTYAGSEPHRDNKVIKLLLFIRDDGSLIGDLDEDLELVDRVNLQLLPAVASLRRALAAGKLRVSGIASPGDGRRRWIDKEEWLPGIEICLDGTARDQAIHEPLLEALRFDGAEVAALWPERLGTTEAGGTEYASEPSLQFPGLKGGRPVKHDWDAFWCEAICWIAKQGLDSRHRAALQKHLENWTALHWEFPPDANTIRKKLARLYRGCDGIPNHA